MQEDRIPETLRKHWEASAAGEITESTIPYQGRVQMEKSNHAA